MAGGRGTITRLDKELTTSMLRDQFLLEKNIVFLNHGSFGAVPRPVFEVYQNWQLKLESQPVKLLARDLPGEIQNVKAALAAIFHSSPENLLLVPNATFAVNLVARSLKLRPGDEILATNHEYGACNNTWRFAASHNEGTYVQQRIPLPLGSPDEVFQQFWAGVTPQTRLIFLSHITSPTAVQLPVARICSEAKRRGILTFIDGAHVPGQMKLNLAEVNADFYTGNCHKWLLAPKSSAFLHVRNELLDFLEPLVVSWGWSEGIIHPLDSAIQDLQWIGTYDPSAVLSIPAAIDFQQKYNWPAVHARSRSVLEKYIPLLVEVTNVPGIYLSPDQLPNQMAAIPLPPIQKPLRLQEHLREDFSIEIPVTEWDQRHFLRISFQAYNTEVELDHLVSALRKILPGYT